MEEAEILDILLAPHAGFCSGVRRAFRITESLCARKEAWFSLGPLVHNDGVIRYFTERGIGVIDRIDDIEQGGIIIRSHGVAPGIVQAARHRGLAVQDATCPLVRRVQDLVQLLMREKYAIIIYGDVYHPEVEGILGWCGQQAIVVADVEEAKALGSFDRLALIAQTTKSTEVFEEMRVVLAAKAEDFRYENTICPASRIRQEEACALSGQVDMMVVIGDPTSSNSRSLASICGQTGVKTLFVARAEQLELKSFRGIARVGVTAGASTPDWIIKEVVERMSEFEEKLQQEETGEQGRQETISEQGAPAVEESAPVAEAAVTSEEAGASSPNGWETPAVETTPDELSVVSTSTGEGTASELETPTKETMSTEESFVRMEAEMADLASPVRGDIIKGKIVEVSDDSAMVDVGGKSEGIIPLRELTSQDVQSAKEVVSVGDEIEVLVLKWDDDGTILLSKKKVDSRRAMEQLEEEFQHHRTVEGTVIGNVKGGLLVDIGVSAFLPASHVEDGYIKDLSAYVGRTLDFNIIEFNRNKKRGSQIVVSRRELVEQEKTRQREAFWNNIDEGLVLTGAVKRIVDYGAFIDLGGFEGLLHISEMDHVRIDHPSVVMQEGDEIEVYILALDREKQRVSLSRKKLLKSPWERVMENYNEGDMIEGQVVRIAPFGAFVQIEAGVDGLVHISQLADRRVDKPEDVVNVGDVVRMKILSIDPKARRIGLSIREADEEQEKEEVQAFMDQQEAQEPYAAVAPTEDLSSEEAEVPGEPAFDFASTEPESDVPADTE